MLSCLQFNVENYKLSKSLNFIILAFLVIISTKNIFVWSTGTMQESKSYASFSTNFITSTNSDDCSELTHEQCLTGRTEDHYLLYPLVIGPARFGDFYK